VRYVVKHARTEQDVDTVFATIMRWPAERTFTFAHLGRANEYFSGEIESIELLGHGAVEHELAMEGLTVQLPIENTNDIAPVFAITFKPGTDKPISLAEFIDYCKPLVEGADGNLKPVNTGSPNVSALSDLGYYVTQAENSLDGTVEEQAAALVVLRKAFQAYLKASVTEAGAPLYAGDNLTVEMLVEAADFSRTPDTRNGKRFGKPANWIVTNFNIPNGSEGVKQGLDAYEGTEALMLGVWDDRSGNQEGNLSDARIYRKLHLDAGVYTMQAEYQTSYSMSPDAYMFASTKLLATHDIPAKSLARLAINKAGVDDGKWYSISFSIKESQDVYVGWQANLEEGSETQEFRVKDIRMLYEPWQIEDAVIAVKNTPAGQDTHYYNLKGQQLSDAPQHGLYIKNGRKVLK